jgi:hypothetical protein
VLRTGCPKIIIFVIAPKALENYLDWRLPVFECGRHIIAFDGVALLLNEI